MTEGSAERHSKRLADAIATAESGSGWDALVRLWGVSKPAAFTWVKTHAPRDVFLRIGQNGRDSRKRRTFNTRLRSDVVALRDLQLKPFREIAEIVNIDLRRVHRIYHETKRTGAVLDSSSAF